MVLPSGGGTNVGSTDDTADTDDPDGDFDDGDLTGVGGSMGDDPVETAEPDYDAGDTTGVTDGDPVLDQNEPADLDGGDDENPNTNPATDPITDSGDYDGTDESDLSDPAAGGGTPNDPADADQGGVDDQNENPATDPITDYPEHESDDTDNVPDGIEGGNTPQEEFEDGDGYDYGDGPVATTEFQDEIIEDTQEAVDDAVPDGPVLDFPDWLPLAFVGTIITVLGAVALWLARPLLKIFAGATD